MFYHQSLNSLDNVPPSLQVFASNVSCSILGVPENKGSERSGYHKEDSLR